MKQCPKCRTTYTDDGLRFCLADGAALTGVGEQETVAARRDNVVRVDVLPTDPSPRAAAVAEPRQSSTGKIIGVIAAVGVLLLLAIVAVGALIYIGTRRDDPTPNKNVVANASPDQTPTP